jgi:signal transduction histidine kinase
MTLQQKIKSIPYWAYLLVFIVIIVNSLYLYYKHKVPYDSSKFRYENNRLVYEYITPGSPDDKAGIKKGDILISINSVLAEIWISGVYGSFSTDKLNLRILRNNKEFDVAVKVNSIASNAPVFYWTVFVFQLLLNITGLFIIFNKPNDRTVRLFFAYMQLYAVTVNGLSLPLPYYFSQAATCLFLLSSAFFNPILIHFYLLFPKPSKILVRFEKLPSLIYLMSAICFIIWAIVYILWSNDLFEYNLLYGLVDRLGVSWVSITFFIAFAIAIYHFLKIRETLYRNQLRLVIIGSFFTSFIAVFYAFFYDYINQLNDYPNLIMVPIGVGSIIMISLILMAIFRYRIWETEFYIRRALLYLSATIIITISYLFLLYIADQLARNETKLIRFIVLAISVMIFMLIKEKLQRIIDRIFHLETYDSATVVTAFEEKLTGVYRSDELKAKIAQGLDGIFHFKSFVLNLKNSNQKYQPEYAIGLDHQKFDKEFELSPESDRMLRKSKVFSPGELEQKLALADAVNAELFVPLVKEDQPFGFFLCGQKKSEKSYSMQDILVLSLIAKRVIALFQTAQLYQKDLERQLMLERERARISQDMHDDIGAGLTKIAMISEARITGPDQVPEVTEKMSKLSSTARDMIARLNVIVWALNPKYDNLDSLVSYIRRYFGEYLDNFEINFTMNAPDAVPDLTITPDFRRNAFYAIQEAIHNAVKHGACSEISLGLNINNNNMIITITDNGKGFDQGKAGSHGNGLIIMKKRAEELGGSFAIQSSPGNGTRISFKINLPENTTKG